MNASLPEISFCIPAYNQRDLLKQCIDRIVEYPGNEIEIVVQDDCSTDDLQELISQYEDPRIRYYRNQQNLGHDLNILRSFRNARAKWAFLLRTRDAIIPEAIPLMLDRLRHNSNASYLTGCAVLPDGKKRICYEREHISCGEETIAAHKKLYIHPSGSAYRIDLLDLEYMEALVRGAERPNMTFLVHVLARLQLAMTGDFEIIKEPLWIYADTRKALDIAVNQNKSSGRKSIYTPALSRMRYALEMQWADQQCNSEWKLTILKSTFHRYLDNVTYVFAVINDDPLMRAHYNCDKEKHSISKERRLIVEQTMELAETIHFAGSEEKADFINYVKLVERKNRIQCPVRYIRSRLARIPLLMDMYVRLRAAKTM